MLSFCPFDVAKILPLESLTMDLYRLCAQTVHFIDINQNQ